MTMNLHVNLKESTNKRRWIQLSDVSSDITVNELKSEIIAKAGLDALCKLDIFHCCKLLKDDLMMKQLEMGSYKSIHAIEVKSAPPSEARRLSSFEQGQLVHYFHVGITNPQFRQTFQSMLSQESINNLLAMIPGLKEDQIAVSLLHDWELMMYFGNPKYLEIFVEKHPELAEAVAKMADSTRVTVASGDPGNPRRSQSGWMARSLGADLDDEDMEDMDAPQQIPSASNVLDALRSSNLTADQSTASTSNPPALSQQQVHSSIAAILASMRERLGPVPAQPSSSFSSTSTTTAAPTPAVVAPHVPSSSSLQQQPVFSALTPAMLNQALQQAMSSIGGANSPPVATPGPVAAQPASQVNDEEANLRRMYGHHLPEMRELGITDDSLSLRALEASNGDVLAAVNFAFYGLMDD